MNLTPLRLAQRPTPLEDWSSLLPGLRIKRDDLTGSTLSGNKVRKLEFLMAHAQALGKSYVVTCGGLQSNHCRATAVAAAQLGMGCKVLLRTATVPQPWDAATGNYRLMRAVGADIEFVTPAEYQDRARLLATAAGTRGYAIPEGGSNGLGAFGYITAAEELVAQWGDDPPTSVVCATGSGGTLAGLAIGLAKVAPSVPAWGVAVCDDAPTFQRIAARASAEACEWDASLPRLGEADFNVLEGYVGRGYALSSSDEQATLMKAGRRGLVLDPVYTVKAFRAVLAQEPAFGPRPIFIHTGGLLGLMT
jgi:D-cysteine desulfhydrase